MYEKFTVLKPFSFLSVMISFLDSSSRKMLEESPPALLPGGSSGSMFCGYGSGVTPSPAANSTSPPDRDAPPRARTSWERSSSLTTGHFQEPETLGGARVLCVFKTLVLHGCRALYSDRAEGKLGSGQTCTGQHPGWPARSPGPQPGQQGQGRLCPMPAHPGQTHWCWWCPP